MSGGNDNPFARWSRRKLSGPSEKPHADTDTQQMEDHAATLVDPETASPPLDPNAPEAADAEAAEIGEPLPRLEDLTVESDFTAFLKKGVPPALKSAALRKMWSLDPGIRDYVGPSEYAWDFNQPGSMAGFGSLKTKETVVGFLSKTVRAIDSDSETGSATFLDASPARPSNAPPETPIDPETVDPSTVAESYGPDPAADVASNADAIAGDSEMANDQHSPDTTRRSQASEPVVRPRHGGALPR